MTAARADPRGVDSAGRRPDRAPAHSGQYTTAGQTRQGQDASGNDERILRPHSVGLQRGVVLFSVGIWTSLVPARVRYVGCIAVRGPDLSRVCPAFYAWFPGPSLRGWS